MTESERFRDADPFIVRCRGCTGEIAFAPIADRAASLLLSSGPTCPACKTPMSSASLQVQLEAQIRAHIARYYEGWMICNDPTCGMRTRMMGVYPRNCLRVECTGKVMFEVSFGWVERLLLQLTFTLLQYSDGQLYNQLRMYHSLFDQDKVLKGARGTDKEKLGEHSWLTSTKLLFIEERHSGIKDGVHYEHSAAANIVGYGGEIY
jgi:DNA polymerase alpha subunit A